MTIFAVAFIAGCLAAINGFGIGSVLVPAMALTCGTKAAVAIVAIPHFCGTALRCWTLREAIDRRLLSTFGWLSVVGSLLGALLHSVVGVTASSVILSVVLIAGGVWGLSGYGDRVRLSTKLSYITGVLSGLLGGLVGNQGGIRAIALIRFDLDKDVYIATTAAIALLVDLSRVPIYFYADGCSIINHAPTVFFCTLAVMVGTVAGSKITAVLPQHVFAKAVSLAVLILGMWKLYPSEDACDKKPGSKSILLSDNEISSQKAKQAKKVLSED